MRHFFLFWQVTVNASFPEALLPDELTLVIPLSSDLRSLDDAFSEVLFFCNASDVGAVALNARFQSAFRLLL